MWQVFGRSGRRCDERSHALLIVLIVPTLCVGMPPATLCVTLWDAERPLMHSHAKRGNDLLSGAWPPPATTLPQHLGAWQSPWPPQTANPTTD
ncbi:hypothetical protein CDH05_16210 [Pseudomonas lactis]|nr:hypothetical protein CDH05_16210 [Pseudomonas lactis]